MRVSISLAEPDVAFLDAEVERGAYRSRSAAVAASVRLLRERDLMQSYPDEFEQWGRGDDAGLWELATGDELGRG